MDCPAAIHHSQLLHQSAAAAVEALQPQVLE
jgi:hypothetical protein